MVNIPTAKLNSGKEMPLLGFGTWQLKGEECSKAVKTALEAGYNHIDTAEMYGNEEYIGEAIKGIPRESLFITSKVWRDNLSYDGVMSAFSQSTSKLGTDYLDMYLIHWPNSSADYEGALRAFKELLDSGKIKSFGVSNFTVRLLKGILEKAEKAGIKISVNQVEFHPMLYQKELLEFCNDKGVVLTAYSPLGRGEVFSNETLSKIASTHSASEGQVALSWLRSKGIVAIPKASSKGHIEANLSSLTIELSPEEIAQIDSISGKRRLVNPPFMDFED